MFCSAAYRLLQRTQLLSLTISKVNDNSSGIDDALGHGKEFWLLLHISTKSTKNIIHTGMQNIHVGYENDCSLARLAENHYMMIAPTIQYQQHQRNTTWNENHQQFSQSLFVIPIQFLIQRILTKHTIKKHPNRTKLGKSCPTSKFAYDVFSTNVYTFAQSDWVVSDPISQILTIFIQSIQIIPSNLSNRLNLTSISFENNSLNMQTNIY